MRVIPERAAWGWQSSLATRALTPCTSACCRHAGGQPNVRFRKLWHCVSAFHSLVSTGSFIPIYILPTVWICKTQEKKILQEAKDCIKYYLLQIRQMKAVCDEAEMADFSKSSFLFPDTNPNKTKVMEDWFFILKQYLKASLMGCGSGNVLSEHSACFRKPPCLPWEGVAGTCHWQSSPDEWASIHPPGARLLTSNSDKCANAACQPRLSEWLTSYNNARLDYSESCGRGAGLPTGLLGAGGGALAIRDGS